MSLGSFNKFAVKRGTPRTLKTADLLGTLKLRDNSLCTNRD